MEDKFGYLMKQEFEEHFIEEIRESLKSEKKKAEMTVFELHDKIVMTWGGYHSANDSDICKI